MSLFCPKDGTACPDDVCRGAGCLETGTRMLERCDGCGVIYDPDIENCDCDDDYTDYPDGPADHDPDDESPER
jgi:hypothetical protein